MLNLKRFLYNHSPPAQKLCRGRLRGAEDAEGNGQTDKTKNIGAGEPQLTCALQPSEAGLEPMLLT